METIPFPEVKIPVRTGDSWNRQLNIHDGWGDWENSQFKTNYKVINLETIEVEYGDLQGWHIQAYSQAEFGISWIDYWFNEDYGFVKMIIKNYRKQSLIVELIDIRE